MSTCKTYAHLMVFDNICLQMLYKENGWQFGSTCEPGKGMETSQILTTLVDINSTNVVGFTS